MSLRPLLFAFAAALAPPAHAGTLNVAATAVPHAEILEFIKPGLAAKGVELRIRVFTDYVQPNTQVAEERLDANYFQTLPYLEQFNIGKGTNLVPVIGVHIEPFGAYSRKHKSLADLPDGATIALPNEVSNTGRALRLLHKAGVIVLKDPANALATKRDVASNPRGFVFRELEAATLPRVLDQVDLALINTNYALDAGLQPTRDALTIEGTDSPYVNYLVARPDNRDTPDMQALAAALTSAEVKAFIEREYQGAVVPAS